MKKVRYLLALIALVILPIKANAAATLEYTVGEPDANGVYKVEIFEKITAGDTEYATFTYNLIAQHCLIQTVTGSGEWTVDSSAIGTNVTAASFTTTNINGTYTGTGEKVKVAEITYVHDPSYTGEEAHKLTITPTGGTAVEITEKTTPNSKTGSFISYVGIGIGVLLIGAAYIVSRKSTKLYRM